jgi:two-component system, OmpR family, sensor histidine kinase MprB
MSLRAKLALLFGAMGLLASALVGVFAFRATEGELVETTDAFLTTRAEEIAGGSRRSPGNRPSGGRNGDENVVVLQQPFEEDALAQTITADGDVLPASMALPVTDNTDAMAALEPGRVSTENVRFDDISIDGTSYRMVSMALPDGGAVQVARATGEDDDVLSALTLRIGLIAAAVAVAGAVAGWLIARQTTSSLRRLAGVASDVAETGDFTTAVDVSSRDEIGQLATSFRSMLAALEESREQQLRLVHDAGHELRTPLTSLRANVALLDRFERLAPDDRREIVAAVESELVELSDLFTELIELATDQRSTDMHVEAIDLADLAERVAERWERRTNREIVLSTTSSPVDGDAAMLERAITNLLSNAHKFSPEGSPIEIVVAAGRLAVRDSGPGVPAADRARIFDRFYRSELTRSMPGSGLGLAIVSQIVELHGGTVFVDDAPDGGAEIGFTLAAR